MIEEFVVKKRTFPLLHGSKGPLGNKEADQLVEASSTTTSHPPQLSRYGPAGSRCGSAFSSVGRVHARRPSSFAKLAQDATGADAGGRLPSRLRHPSQSSMSPSTRQPPHESVYVPGGMPKAFLGRGGGPHPRTATTATAATTIKIATALIWFFSLLLSLFVFKKAVADVAQ